MTQTVQEKEQDTRTEHPAPRESPEQERHWLLLFCCWLLVTGSTMGSLFFSEVMEFAPCSLCWYQRIFMFSLVVVLSAGLFPLDRGVVRYALPLAACGWTVALYHTLLYTGVLPKSAAPCSLGVSCTEVYIELAGFLSIPLMSLLAFSALLGLLLVLRKAFNR